MNIKLILHDSGGRVSFRHELPATINSTWRAGRRKYKNSWRKRLHRLWALPRYALLKCTTTSISIKQTKYLTSPSRFWPWLLLDSQGWAQHKWLEVSPLAVVQDRSTRTSRCSKHHDSKLRPTLWTHLCLSFLQTIVTTIQGRKRSAFPAII